MPPRRRVPRSGEDHTTSPGSTSPSSVRCIINSPATLSQAPRARARGTPTGPGINKPLGGPVPRQAPRARAPDATSSAGGEGSTPNHPAALRLGMRMGSDSPEQHNLSNHRNERKRSQVRLAAPAARRGGFGTFVPGARCGANPRPGGPGAQARPTNLDSDPDCRPDAYTRQSRAPRAPSTLDSDTITPPTEG